MQIVATGTAVPKMRISSADIDRKMGFLPGHTEKVTGMVSRYYATTETASDMARQAIDEALASCPLSINDIDCLIAASGTMEQAIPYNAAMIHASLKFSKPIPTFDVNMTCLSALMAIDLAGTLINQQQYKTILIVSSEIASVGLDWKNIETGGIFGDGAAAVIVAETEQPAQGILCSHFETYSEGIDYCTIKGGGSRYHPSRVQGDYASYGRFEMSGKEVYKLAARKMGDFIHRLLDKAAMKLNDIDWFVPHQASSQALAHLQKSLKIDSDKIVTIIQTRGNQIAASIPSALNYLCDELGAKRGDRIMLIGTSAGMSIGGMIVEY